MLSNNAQPPLQLRMQAHNAELSYSIWAHPSSVAALVHFHGIESHSGWYKDFAAQLWSRGISVYCMDRVGSGLSSGPRNHIDSWRTWIAHAKAMLERARTENPGKPIFVAGSCWGAKVVLQLAICHPREADGLILISPALRMRVALSFFVTLSVAASWVLSPRREYSIPINDEQMFTRIADHLDFIRKDPLRLRTATASFLVETRKLDSQNKRTLKELRIPTLVLLAERDEIVNVPAVEAQLRKVNGIDMRTIPDTSHSMEFAPSAEKLAHEIVSWTSASTNAKCCETVLRCTTRCGESATAGRQ
jgi:acylglycerol lipase